MKISGNKSIPWYSQSDTYGRTAVQWYDQVRFRNISRFPTGFWDGATGKQNAAECLEHAFKNVLHLQFDRATRTIDPLLRERCQTKLLAKMVNAPGKNWQNLFHQMRLLGCLNIPEFKNSPAIAIMRSFPWAFDPVTPEGEHLHAWDFIIKDLWTGDKGFELAKSAVRHVFEKHLGVTMDPATGTIDERMMPEPGAKFPEKYSRLPREFGCTEWWELFKKEGIDGMLFIQPKFRMKPYLALKYSFSWAFDLSTSEGKHLHPWDFFQTGLWSGPEGLELGRSAVSHVISSHLGLKMKPPDPKTGEYEIDKRLLEGRIGEFFAANGGKNWASLQNDELLFIKEIYNQNPDLVRNFHQTFRWTFPWAFNLDTPEGSHAHFWEVSREFDWINDKDIIEAVTHAVDTEGWQVNELPEKATLDWLKSVRLAGLVDRFKTRTELFKFVYKYEFEKGLVSEADFSHIYTTEARAPHKPIVSYREKGHSPYASVTVERTTYRLPIIYKGCVAKRTMPGVITIFKLNRGTGYVPVSKFTAADTEYALVRPEDIEPIENGQT